jgi:hypothetical protein
MNNSNGATNYELQGASYELIDTSYKLRDDVKIRAHTS